NVRVNREISAGNGPAWLDELRDRGRERFDLVGFPKGTEEEWRFTNITPIIKTEFKPAKASASAGANIRDAFTFGKGCAAELVIVDGKFMPELSRIRPMLHGIVISGLAEAIAANHPALQKHLGKYVDLQVHSLAALNTAMIEDGAFVYIPRSASVDGPIHLLFVSTKSNDPTVWHGRNLIAVDENADVQIVESYVGLDGTYWTNAVTEIVAAKDSRIDHCKLQQESRQSYHTANMHVELGAGAQFVSHSATLGGKLTRNDLTVRLAGQRADATLNGLVVLSGDQHCDNHTLLDHAAPNCPSHELYKHVLADQSSGVFKGKIFVHQIAQKTDSKQTSKSLLLSDDATMNSQPALEIYADDVKCTHGSTTGPVDEDMVFYLRTRGVGLDAARHLLTYAFAADITRRIRVEPVRRRLEDFMAEQHGLPMDLRITDLGEHDEKAGV
ncbi:MAG TPA: Fe-S cluster assembly protein SufD, partial [Tepidisphaeraceae bacterium]|nr:Fe-S cluster assembly protein SufD [Tepidisphaeraceae bacterium]